MLQGDASGEPVSKPVALRASRRELLGLVAAGAVTALGGCSAAAGHGSRSGAASTSNTSTASRSTSGTPMSSTTSASGYQPTGAVLQRISKSGLLFALQGADGISDHEVDGVIAVGDVPEDRVRVVAQLAKVGRDELLNLLGTLPSYDTLVLLPKSDTEFHDWSGTSPMLADVWGVTIPGANDRQLPFVVLDSSAPGVAQPTLIQDDQVLAHVIAHEMFHATTLESDIPVCPLWVTEGFAELAGQRALLLVPTAPPATPVVPTDEQLRGSRASDYYFLAWTIADHMARTYGDRAAIRFYRDQIDHPGTSLDVSCRSAFGVQFTTVAAAWRAAYPARVKSL